MNLSEYRLYESIQQVGLLQPLIYAKNLDSQAYELYGGGRTRLRLLDAIQQERSQNGQDPIAVPIVRRETPVSSIELNLSHLIQNQVRRDRTFIDKALHLTDCIKTREQELSKKMSQREVVRWLRDNGFPISQSLVNDLRFTATKLYPHLPLALNHGMGRRQVTKIRALYRTMCEIWTVLGEDMKDCQEAFEDTCAECDAEHLDLDWFREIMETEICLWCGLDLQYVRAMVQVNADERARLIALLAGSKSQSKTSKPKPRIRPVLQSNTVPIVEPKKVVPKTRPQSQVCGLPPAVVNRRKRYARRVALDLAQSTNLLDCVSGSMTNAIGYSVLATPNGSDDRTTVAGEFLRYCEQAVAEAEVTNQRLSADWRVVDPVEFKNICSLLEVTHTLCGAQRQKQSKSAVKQTA